MALVPAKCTQCGGNIEVDDTHEAGICKFCGTPFVTEKVINNYTTNITNNIVNDFSGANVTFSNTTDINKLYQTARRFKNDCNSEEAAKYYDMILKEDPESWEAYFYCSYYKALPKYKNEIQNSAMSIVICLDTIFEMIDKREKDTDSKVNALNEVSEKCLSLASTLHKDLLQNNGENVPMTELSSHLKSVATVCVYIATICYMVGDKIEQRFPQLLEKTSKMIVNAWKQGVEYHVDCNNFLPNKSEGRNIINSYVEKIKKIEPHYNSPIQKESNTNNSSGGCYIATCVYGSYDCPQVWTLRRYRDYTLDETWYGRLFIKCYYAVSPKLVKWFGKYDWFRKPWKKFLDGMVKRLNSKGIADTIYNDKY